MRCPHCGFNNIAPSGEKTEEVKWDCEKCEKSIPGHIPSGNQDERAEGTGDEEQTSMEGERRENDQHEQRRTS
jgi:hypothetical protein